MIYHGGPPAKDEDERGDSSDPPDEDLGRRDPVAFDSPPDLDHEDDLDDEIPAARRESRRRRLERILPDAIKRAIERGLETGIGTLTNSREALQGVVNKVDLKNVELPKEVVHYVFSQVDDTKNAMVRGVAREVREFLQAADLAKELQRALTSLSFEIRTEIRFKPNDAGGVTPEVKADLGPIEKPRRRGLRRPSAGSEDPDE